MGWPFRTITIGPGTITPNAMGRHTFTPEQVTAVELTSTWGINRVRVHYSNRPNAFPDFATFETASNTQPLLDAIAAAGFSRRQA